MNWEYLRSDEMKEAIEKSGGLCVLPLGCLEKHGNHLPLGTDSLEGRTAVEMAAELEYAVVFPTGMWFGDVMGAHSRINPKDPGFIGLNPHTLLTVLEELCDEIARNGFRKILICNSHGGNKPLLSFFLRCQGYKQKNYATMWTMTSDKTQHNPELLLAYYKEHRAEYPMLTDHDFDVLQHFIDMGGFGGGHADFNETARIMGAYPELVDTTRYEVESGLSTHRADYLADLGVDCKGAWGANYPNNFSGFSSEGCTKTLGEAHNLYSARRLANIFKVLKEDEECVNIATGK